MIDGTCSQLVLVTQAVEAEKETYLLRSNSWVTITLTESNHLSDRRWFRIFVGMTLPSPRIKYSPRRFCLIRSYLGRLSS